MPTTTDIVSGCNLDLGAVDRIAWNCMSVRPSLRASRDPRRPNNVRHLREELLLTKAELARKAGVSPLTVARIESGLDCRVDTKRKIILALGLTPSDKAKVFGEGRTARKGGRVPSPRT